jgi:hypothetical protein
LDGQASKSDYLHQDVDGGGWVDSLGVNTATLVLHLGHGSPDSLVFTTQGLLPLNSYDPRLLLSWGHDQLCWLGFDACNVMQEQSGGHYTITKVCEDRWGPAFDGLHIMLGFTTPAVVSVSYKFAFGALFAQNILGTGDQPMPPMTILNAWFDAVNWGNTGTPAAMGPILKVFAGGADGLNQWRYISDFKDHYWGKGPVGPQITGDVIDGFWYQTVK